MCGCLQGYYSEVFIHSQLHTQHYSEIQNLATYITMQLQYVAMYMGDPVYFQLQYSLQGRSQEFQKGVSINGRMSIKQGSVGLQLQMLTNCTHVNFEFSNSYPISLYSQLASEQFHTTQYKTIAMLESIINTKCMLNIVRNSNCVSDCSIKVFDCYIREYQCIFQCAKRLLASPSRSHCTQY